MRICCWQPVLTAHQSYTLAALGEASGASIRIVSSANQVAERKGQGWTLGESGAFEHEILPEAGWRGRIDEIVAEERDAIHIFGSPFERAKQNRALIACLRRNLRTFLIAEPYSPIATGYLVDEPRWKARLKAWLRPSLYRIYGTALRRRISGVFAISPASVRQFAAMGIDRSRIFPFGYFVPLRQISATPKMQDDGPVRVAYLGSFIERKGVALLLEAFKFATAGSLEATLTLYGPGSEAIAHGARCPRIVAGGQLRFGEVDLALAKHDLLVVPSLYDGWAVVVNEAIGSGTPVLASDRTGAGAVLEKWDCGALFRSGDCGALARALAKICADRGQLAQWSENTRAAAASLQPEVAGRYMRDCIAAAGIRPPPTPPWY